MEKLNGNGKFSTITGISVNDVEEPYPSLSDYHDYEPNLEFDDSELQHSNSIAQSTSVQFEVNGCGEVDIDVTDPIDNFIEDDNFEEELAQNTGEETLDSFIYSASDANTMMSTISGTNLNNTLVPNRFAYVARHGIIDVKGDDPAGRKIVVVYACKLPPIAQIDHGQFLQYLTHTLDKFVEQDYSLVYFHYGLCSKNKPSLRWLVQAYKAFDRKYKKNLKALYLVHPTSFLKFVSQIFRPFISVKFGRKLNYVHNLRQLNEHIPLDKLDIPSDVVQHDRCITGYKNIPVSPPNNTASSIEQQQQKPSKDTPSSQFGVTLQAIKEHYGVTIPPVVKQCVEYLDQPDALETEGLFRRSASASKVKQLKEIVNHGEPVVFTDVHEAAVLLKTFLRELKEPLLTYDLYEEVMLFQSWNRDEQLRLVSILVMEKLPVDNYQILKYIISFLSRVMERSDLNKMNAQNLAVVFGPNLVWSEIESMSLVSIGPINMFTQFLLQHCNEIFMI